MGQKSSKTEQCCEVDTECSGGQFKTGEFCWTELATPDVKAAKEFYGKVFGWTFADHDMGDTTYTMIKLSDKQAGGIWAIPKEMQKQVPPHWMTYILIDNLEEALKKATKHGAKITRPAMSVGDFGRFAIIADPTGAHIALWEAAGRK